jgi:putative ABC transport system substrate-binding protein
MRLSPRLDRGRRHAVGGRFLDLARGLVLGVPLSVLGAIGPTAAQPTDVPVIGFIHTQSADAFPHLVAAFREGLAAGGYVEGGNVRVEYRWAGGEADRLPELAAELVDLDVDLIFAGGGSLSALAAEAASGTIPIVFSGLGADPVALGLVESFNRPGGNVTGIFQFNVELEAKRLALLDRMIPRAAVIAVLVNPRGTDPEPLVRIFRDTATNLDRTIEVFSAGTEVEVQEAFARIKELGAAALAVGSSPFFNSRRDEIIALVAGLGIPAIFEQREFVLAGGLMSYGTSLAGNYRQAAAYAALILDGQSPADLPVLQATEFEFVINARTAREIGFVIPPDLFAAATELIE